MCLYVRQAAWLNTIPDKAKVPRRESRGIVLPPLECGGHIVEALFEIGPCKPAGMGGAVAIDDQDILAWQINQQIELTPWEARAVRILSNEYAAMLSKSSEPNCPPPYWSADALTAEKRAKIAKGMSDWADQLNEQRGKTNRK